MFYRRAGIRHTTYRQERQLWPLPFDRFLVGLVAALLIIAPFVVDRLYLVAYLLPWLIWSSAALGLNLLMGGAGQIHLGYGAVMAIGAYTSVHLVRFGAPFELAMLAGGLASAVIGSIFGFAALRVKSLYLAMATIAMQYIVDFVITHVPGIVFERYRYKPLEPGAPGPGWEKTGERFVDDESGQTVTVYSQRETGERQYVRD